MFLVGTDQQRRRKGIAFLLFCRRRGNAEPHFVAPFATDPVGAHRFRQKIFQQIASVNRQRQINRRRILFQGIEPSFKFLVGVNIGIEKEPLQLMPHLPQLRDG